VAEVPMQSMHNPRTGIRTKLVVDKFPTSGVNSKRIKATGHGHVLSVPYQDYLTSSENHRWAEKAFFDKYRGVLPSWCQSAKLELYKGIKPLPHPPRFES